jgi:hypothetical protein
MGIQNRDYMLGPSDDDRDPPSSADDKLEALFAGLLIRSIRPPSGSLAVAPNHTEV